MKKTLMRLLIFALPVCAVAALLFAAPDDERAAYCSVSNVCGDRGRFIHDRLNANPRPVDVLFVGMSNVINALDDEGIERVLHAKYGKTLHLLNIGYCRPGRNLHYVMLKDALRARKIRHVVLGVPGWEPRESHPVFAYLADSEDILRPPLLGNDSYVRDILLGLSARLERRRNEWLYPDLTLPPVSDRVYGYDALDLVASVDELEREERRRMNEHERRSGRWDLSSGYPVAYLEEIARLCREHGVQLHFIYLPRYGEPWGAFESAEVYRELGELLLPPREPFEDRSCWADSSHFNADGAAWITPWLAAQIASWETR